VSPQSGKTLIRIAAAAIFLLIVIWFMKALESITTLVLVAFFLAYILDPLVNRLCHRGLSRGVSALLILLLGLSFFIGLLLIVVPAITGEIASFSRKAPAYLAALADLLVKTLDRFEVKLPQDWSEVTPVIIARVRELVPKLADPAARIVSTVFSSVFRSTLGILSALLHLVMIPVLAFYLMVSFEHVRSGILDLIPAYAREAVMAKLREIDLVLAGFVRGQLTIACILGVLYSIGFLIVGIDLAVVLGILSGLLWIIPYVGTVFGLVMGVLMALAKFGDLAHPFYIVLSIAIIQTFEGYVLTPRIVGEAIGLNPVLYILALLIGAQLFGFVGMLVAIPVTAVLKVLMQSALEAYKKSSLYTDKPEESVAE